MSKDYIDALKELHDYTQGLITETSEEKLTCMTRDLQLQEGYNQARFIEYK